MTGSAIAVIGAGMIGAAHAFGYKVNIDRISAGSPACA